MQTGNQLNYRRFLLDELQRRQKKNPAYSLRAFSRDLGMTSSRLSEVLSGKVGLSEDRAAVIADRLHLDEKTKALFVDFVQAEHSRSMVARAAARTRIEARALELKQMENHEFSLISDWYYIALLELLNIEGLEHTVPAFAQKLVVSETLIQESIQKLTELGYLQREGDRWVATEPDSTTTTEISSEAIRSYHRQILEKAQSALQKPIEERDFSSMMFALNSEQLQYAKERLQEMRRTLVKELEGMPGKNAVYCLSLQLFEVTGEQQ